MKHETFFSILFMRLKFIEKKGLFRHTPTLFHFSEFFRKKRRLYVGHRRQYLCQLKKSFLKHSTNCKLIDGSNVWSKKYFFSSKTNGKFLYQTREQQSSSFDLPPPFYQKVVRYGRHENFRTANFANPPPQIRRIRWINAWYRKFIDDDDPLAVTVTENLLRG